MGETRPNIRFTTTSDGVEIGFWEIGSGPPLLLAQNRSLSHAELEWSVPAIAGLHIELARYFRLIRFDPRGAGISSQPAGSAVTHAGLAEDIAAVIRALDVNEVNLVGAISLGPAAVQHAVSHPESVTRLVLCDTGPRLSDLPLDAYVRATDALVELGVVPSLGGLFSSTPTEDLPALERLMRASLYDRPRIAPRDLRHFDVNPVLGQVKAPTLIIKSEDSLYTDTTQTRALLKGIPGAEMRVVPGTMAPWLADRDAVVDAMVSFLTSGRHRPAALGQGVVTVVFTDIVSSTEVLDSVGDEEGRRSIRDIEGEVSRLTTGHGGRLVKNLGDGSLITFNSTRNAIAFALELQDRMVSRGVLMRIGMAAGEPIQEQGDVHGAVVAQASRLVHVGQAGDVVVSDSVRQLALGKDFEFISLGQVSLRGFHEEQHVWKATRALQKS